MWRRIGGFLYNNVILFLCLIAFLVSFKNPEEVILERRNIFFANKINNNNYYGGLNQQTKYRFVIKGYVQKPTFIYNDKIYDQNQNPIFQEVDQSKCELIQINTIDYKLINKSIRSLRSVKGLKIIKMTLIDNIRWNVHIDYENKKILLLCNIGIPNMKKFTYLWKKYKFDQIVDLRFDNFMLYDN